MKKRRFLALLLALMMSLGLMAPASAAGVSDALNDTAKYLVKTVPDPQVGSIGGEWAVIGLARSDYDVSDSYFTKYYKNVEDYVKACGGVLHKRKYTEYSREILALTAIGKDPTNVAGYDLTKVLEDFNSTVWQGINGAIWALIALDSGNYANDQRQAYIDHILDLEISGGGWSLTGDAADADITGMALQALAKYQDQPAVKAATERALTWLSKTQNSDGSYSTIGEENCESTVQVIVALCELGIDLEDSRFVKNGNSAMDGLMNYYVKGNGFTHVKGGGNGADGMSTEQGFYALVAADRAAKGQSSLYRMTEGASDPSANAVTFSDIVGHKNQTAIEKLAGMEIINGMGGDLFAPNETMTRAQFCTIVVKALGLTPRTNNSFSDVPTKQWYAGYVGAASDKGIVNGVGGNKFAPNGTITRQDAVTMVTRAAKVMGLDTSVDDADEILLLFSDGTKVAVYSKEPLAWCYESGILADEGSIQPAKAILRCEIAQMIYNMLDLAGKI